MWEIKINRNKILLLDNYDHDDTIPKMGCARKKMNLLWNVMIGSLSVWLGFSERGPPNYNKKN